MKDKNGYGKIRMGTYSSWWIPAHRASFQIHIGPIPKDLFVLHNCDNPSCVNPEHLRIGTAKDNAQDKELRNPGTQVGLAGEENGRAKLTWTQVEEIRMSQDTLRALAARYGMASSTIYLIKAHKTWKTKNDNT